MRRLGHDMGRVGVCCRGRQPIRNGSVLCRFYVAHALSIYTELTSKIWRGCLYRLYRGVPGRKRASRPAFSHQDCLDPRRGVRCGDRGSCSDKVSRFAFPIASYVLTEDSWILWPFVARHELRKALAAMMVYCSIVYRGMPFTQVKSNISNLTRCRFKVLVL